MTCIIISGDVRHILKVVEAAGSALGAAWDAPTCCDAAVELDGVALEIEA